MQNWLLQDWYGYILQAHQQSKFTSSGKIRLVTYCDPHRNSRNGTADTNIKKITSLSDNFDIFVYGNDPKLIYSPIRT